MPSANKDFATSISIKVVGYKVRYGSLASVKLQLSLFTPSWMPNETKNLEDTARELRNERSKINVWISNGVRLERLLKETSTVFLALNLKWLIAVTNFNVQRTIRIAHLQSEFMTVGNAHFYLCAWKFGCYLKRALCTESHQSPFVFLTRNCENGRIHSLAHKLAQLTDIKMTRNGRYDQQMRLSRFLCFIPLYNRLQLHYHTTVEKTEIQKTL